MKGGDPVFNGQQVRALRLQKRLSQVALAQATGVTAPYISFLESGQRGTRPSYPFVLRLARALDVDPGAFLAG
jgi:transcriptional regulator with XRE-family HTH domain